MIPSSMAYCRGSMVQVPLKIPKAQRTPGECKWEEMSLPSHMKANPLSFPHVSSANHTASLKLSLIPSLSQKLIFKSLLYWETHKSQGNDVVLVNSEEQGQQESIWWLSVFGKWKIPTTCRPFTNGGDPFTPSHLYPPEKPVRQLAGLGGLHVHEKWKWADYVGIGPVPITPCSDLPSRCWYSYSSPSSWALGNTLKQQMSCLSISGLILFQKNLRNPRDKSNKILLGHRPHT